MTSFQSKPNWHVYQLCFVLYGKVAYEILYRRKYYTVGNIMAISKTGRPHGLMISKINANKLR